MGGLSVVLVGASIWCGYLAFRRTGEWLHPLTILLAEGFLLGTARREGFSPSLVPVLPLDAGLAVIAGLLGAQAVGLPLPLARRLGFGLRSREWEYDRSLFDILDGFNRLLEAYPGKENAQANQRWGRTVLDRGPALVVRLRRMRAPNPAWDELTQAYADLYELILMNLREGEDPERRAMIDRQGWVLKDRREALRRAYREVANRTMSRRNGGP